MVLLGGGSRMQCSQRVIFDTLVLAFFCLEIVGKFVTFGINYTVGFWKV